MIDLHYVATPNGQKISIMVEECGLDCTIIPYDIFEGEQHTAEFGKINPNHKLPAIVDHDPPFGGGPHIVFESGAILQYLAEKTGKFIAADPRQRSVQIQWLTWQVAGVGPMVGQAAHFTRYAPDGNDYAVNRYVKEVERLMHVLERRLGESEYVGGPDYSIVDMALWPSRRTLFMRDENKERWPNSLRWFEAVGARPAVVRGWTHERWASPQKYMNRKQHLNPTEWSNMFGEKMLAAVKL